MTPQDRERYSRQIVFEGLGEAGQEALLGSRAVIAGCGALGTLHAAALARAGVGEIVLIDRDFVETSNLQRQWLFDERDAAEGLPKAAAAASKLRAANSGVRIIERIADLHAGNAEELLLPARVILDGTDNFEARYLLNDVAVKHGVPWIYGAAVGSYGATMPVLPGRSACLACMFPEPPQGLQPTCETAGVLNAATSLIASLQAVDALKILSGNAGRVEPRLLAMDIWHNTLQTLHTNEADPECRVCGRREFTRLTDRRRRPVALCGRDSVQVHDRDEALDLDRLRRTLEPLGDVRYNGYVLRFSTPPYDLTIFDDGRAIIKGVRDEGAARSLYARYVTA